MAPTTSPRTRVRILVLGSDGVGKTALVSALCGADPHESPESSPGARVSVRLSSGDNPAIEEYYDVSGAARFEPARAALLRRSYDALVLVHDLTDASTRASLRRKWAPAAMESLGDAAALSAGGRGGAPHVRSRGALNEIALLWRSAQSSYSGVSATQAARESVRLFVSVLRLALHEAGVWVDERVDRAAERELLDGSAVPVALVGSKGDIAPIVDGGDDAGAEETRFARGGKDVFVVNGCSSGIAEDARFDRFLERARELVREGGRSPAHRRASSSGVGHSPMAF